MSATPVEPSNRGRLLATPMLTAHGRYRDASFATGAGRFSYVHPRIWELVFRCLEGVDREQLLYEGWTDCEIVASIDAGLLVSAEDPSTEAGFLWEEHNWVRMGHLLRSQLDIPYLEQDAATFADKLEPLSRQRRAVLQSYLADGPYPSRRPPAHGVSHQLPGKEARPPHSALDSAFGRRTLRKFSAEAIQLSVLGSILWRSTENIRIAEESQASGDPYYFLNSFYSWLEIYVVVQNVQNLQRGAYRYDPIRHALTLTRAGVSDEQVVATIAHQPWASGSGAAVYICSQWERYSYLYRHSRAYLNLLIQVGEYAQELVTAVECWGLGAWESPALHESLAGELLAVPDGVEPVHFVKFGPH